VEHIGKIQGNVTGTCRERSENMQVTFREHSGNMQGTTKGTFREHSGNMQGTTKGTCREHSGDMFTHFEERVPGCPVHSSKPKITA
jgi:hypothetical protein